MPFLCKRGCPLLHDLEVPDLAIVAKKEPVTQREIESNSKVIGNRLKDVDVNRIILRKTVQFFTTTKLVILKEQTTHK